MNNRNDRTGEFEKLVFAAKSSVITSNLVRLPDDAIEIVRQTQFETGISASKIVARILRWAEDKIEIREV